MAEVTDPTGFLQVQGPKFSIIPEWVLYHPTLSDCAIRVYGVLARFAGYDEIRPSLSHIGQKIGKSPDAVRRALHQLAEVGAVVVTPRFDAGGKSLPNLYTLVTDQPVHNPRSDTLANLPPLQIRRGDPGKNARQEKESKRDRTTQVAAAPQLRAVPSDLGGDPDAPPRTEGKQPGATVRVVDHFLSEWHTTVRRHPEYGMLQRVPNKAAAYKWLNTTYFKPKHGDPVSVDYVLGLVDEFMQRVRHDQITPSPGYTAWQAFQRNVGRFSGEQVTGDVPGTVYV